MKSSQATEAVVDARAAWLTAAREAKGWAKGKLDREAKLPSGSVNGYECKGREPSIRNLRALAPTLDIEIADLLAEG